MVTVFPTLSDNKEPTKQLTIIGVNTVAEVPLNTLASPLPDLALICTFVTLASGYIDRV